MTVQTVPYALQNASHSAALFRQATSGPYSTPGVLGVGELAVGAQSTPNMSVQVGAGRAKVSGSQISPPTLLSGATAAFTTQAMYDVLNDGPVSLTIATSDPTNPRIDTVYVSVQDAYYSGSNNQAVLGVVTGTPAPTPTAPAAPSNSLVLGQVAVAANATSIVAGNVTNVAALTQLQLGAVTGTFTPTGIYSNGTPAPVLESIGGRTSLDGIVTSSSASFTAGTFYTLGSITASFAPSTQRIFLCLANVTNQAEVVIAPTGTITFSLASSLTSTTLALSLANCIWR